MITNMIVPTLNRYDLLDTMMQSIDVQVYHLLIIDNGGTLDRLSFNDNVRDVTILNMPSNMGIATSWNLGIKSFPHADRWLITSDDVQWLPGGLAQLWGESDVDTLTVCDEWPHYQAFVVGEDVVSRVGLFDEGIYPANFEDDDYARRVEYHGFELVEVPVNHTHVKQGTVFHSDYRELNSATYPHNEFYFSEKVHNNDFGEGHWSLKTRRINSWD